jgi:hypothetical protein
MDAARRPVPLRQRKLDQVLIFGFLTFAFTCFAFDRLAATHADLEQVDGFFARYLVVYGRTVDPLVLANPLWLRIMSGISAFAMGPFYFVMVRAFVKGDERIRIPALIYVCAILYSMVVHFGVEFFGDLPPLNLPVFLATYAPYVVVPLLLAFRMRDPHPFTVPAESADEAG